MEGTGQLMISHYRSQGGGRVQGSSLVTTGPREDGGGGTHEDFG